MAAIFERDLETFLRRGLSGYVYVILVSPIILVFLNGLGNKIDIAIAALLALAGPAIGAIIYQIWHLIYWTLSWKTNSFMKFWGLDHVKRLKRIGDKKNIPHRYLRAIWDKVFFTEKFNKNSKLDEKYLSTLTNESRIRKRILNQSTRAHSSATVGMAIFFAVLTWVWAFCTGYYSRFLLWELFLAALVVVVFVLMLDHWRLCQEAAALENLFLQQRIQEVTQIITDHSNAWKRDP